MAVAAEPQESVVLRVFHTVLPEILSYLPTPVLWRCRGVASHWCSAVEVADLWDRLVLVTDLRPRSRPTISL